MITHFARRALAQPSTPEVLDINNLCASAFLSPVAIYVASLASFRLWKALEHYDASPLGLKPIEEKNGKLSRKHKIILAFIFLFVLGLEGTVLYGAFTASDAIVNGFVAALSFFVSWAGFASPVSYFLCDAVVRRIPGTKRAMPFVAPLKAHRRRRIISSWLCALAAAATTYTGNSIAWNIAITGFAFRLIATAPPVSRKGWTSVRGVVIGLLSYITLILVLVAGILFFIAQIDGGKKETNDETGSDDVKMPFGDEGAAQRITSFSNSFYTSFIGMLIALVYRAEAVKSSAAVRLQDSSEELQWEIPAKHGHGHGHHGRHSQPESEVAQTGAAEVIEAPAPAPATDAPESPIEHACTKKFKWGRKAGGCCKKNGKGMKRCGGRGRKFLKSPGVILPSSRTVPSFSPLTTPIATLALLTYIIVHIPALLLASENPTFGLKWLLTAPEVEQDKWSTFWVEVLALIPPRLWAIVLVPVVVGVACVFRWNKGGKEMWTYAEEWVLMKDQKAKESEGEAVEVATVEASAAGADEKASPPAYEVLFDADKKDVAGDVKA